MAWSLIHIATDFTLPVQGSGRNSGFHTLMCPLRLVSEVPSGAIATANTPRVWLAGLVVSLPVGRSQIRTFPLSSAVASQVPSGAIATDLTLPLWPERMVLGVAIMPIRLSVTAFTQLVAVVAPLARFQIDTVPLSLPLASQVPSGAMATSHTPVLPLTSEMRVLSVPRSRTHTCPAFSSSRAT
ncbi:hypothetical protein EES39_38950 [Streptomyces sp. ADI92-24]|nr:hypothetical protein EES39_38950 [Streptomyces sp. ADI92-24]